MTAFLVCATKQWNQDAFTHRTPNLPGDWSLFTHENELTPTKVQDISPRYIFFPHWSWMVPAEITSEYECVCFHMTDLPYGRGGSPLQNLISRRHKDTMLTALRMVDELDAGPVYLKSPLSCEGSAQNIYERTAALVYDMIEFFVSNEPEPTPQKGEPVFFKRRHPSESSIPTEGPISHLFDHIRMLDADTYPRAFLEYGAWRIEFSKVRNASGKIIAEVEISSK